MQVRKDERIFNIIRGSIKWAAEPRPTTPRTSAAAARQAAHPATTCHPSTIHRIPSARCAYIVICSSVKSGLLSRAPPRPAPPPPPPGKAVTQHCHHGNIRQGSNNVQLIYCGSRRPVAQLL